MIIHRFHDGSEGFEYEPGDRVIVQRTIQGGWFDYGPTNAERCIIKRRNTRSNRPSSWMVDSLDIHYSDEWGYAECNPWHVTPHPETYEAATVVLEVTPAQKAALRDWNPGSIGGAAILRGWHAFEAGEPVPTGWPYLAERGWYAAKAHAEKNNA